jgi:putative hydroxymethylpyrimidine transport system permease protein
MGRALRTTVMAAGLLAAWQLLVWATGVPPYILPGPLPTGAAMLAARQVLVDHAAVTLVEMGLGLAMGAVLGAAAALAMAASAPVRRWVMPLLVISQALPVFALAPLLVLWLGYGLASKVVMTVLIIFFPVTAAFYDGLRATDPGWLELAGVMNAPRTAVLWQIRAPAALPGLASGLRAAAAAAPIGAVVGEWVGASQGLGFLMLHANARLETDLMAAALLVLVAAALVVYHGVDYALRRLLYWLPAHSM